MESEGSEIEGLEREGLETDNLEGFTSRNKETIIIHNAACSCVVELREAVTFSRIFFPEWFFFRGFSISASLKAVHEGGQNPPVKNMYRASIFNFQFFCKHAE